MSKVRLIDANALKKHITEIYETEERIDKKWAMGLKYSLKIIDKAPTVSFMISPDYVTELQNRNKELIKQLEELERPQGEWENDSDNLPICNKCGEIALQRIFVKMPHLIQDVRMVRSNYCPNCGADMRGGKE